MSTISAIGRSGGPDWDTATSVVGRMRLDALNGRYMVYDPNVLNRFFFFWSEWEPFQAILSWCVPMLTPAPHGNNIALPALSRTSPRNLRVKANGVHVSCYSESYTCANWDQRLNMNYSRHWGMLWKRFVSYLCVWNTNKMQVMTPNDAVFWCL